MQPILSLRGIWKAFERRLVPVNALQDRLLKHESEKKVRLQVLSDVSLDVKPGEWVGIYGKNGSGKTTLLRIITGLMEPDAGTVRRNGSISCFFGLGVGFHPDLTARQNIVRYGLFSGWSKEEADSATDGILRFADLPASHLGLPIKCYSTGMHVRLAFAAATHNDADLHIFDEVFAVGDRDFMLKCKAYLADLRAQGKAGILVSHEYDDLQRFCDRIIHMEDGKLVHDEPTTTAGKKPDHLPQQTGSIIASSPLPAPLIPEDRPRLPKWLLITMVALLVIGTSELLSWAVLSVLDSRIVTYAGLHDERRAVIAANATFVDTTQITGAKTVLATNVPAPFDGFESEILHPYMGYVYDRPIAAATGTYMGFGFWPEATIHRRAPDTVIVGIFGGSMAMMLARDGKKVLQEEFAKLPAFRGKKIIVVQAGAGGYKQPQQLMAFEYLQSMGGQFDVVINLDGFNEITLPAIENLPNGVSPWYPRDWVYRVQEFSNTPLLSAMGSLTLYKEWRIEMAKVADTFPMRYSMTASAVWKGVDRLMDKLIRLKRYQMDNIKPVGREKYVISGPAYARTLEDADGIVQDSVQHWARGSTLMRQAVEASGAQYYHFLQPNQYQPDSKPMSAEELKKAFNPTSPYRPWVVKGYPLLQSEGAALKADGEDFLSLTDIFKNHPESLYFDSCCHVIQNGSDIIARRVVEFIGKETANP
jgi:ABC-type polysaccharide/polyol phosphate transport system ATPase subunit